MATWVLLVVDVEGPEPAMTEFSAAIDMTGWTRIEGMKGCWYGRMGRLNWRQAIIAVERMLEIAALTSRIEREVPFVVHTGESAPHRGTIEAADNMAKSLRPKRKVYTKRLPTETKGIRPPEHPTTRLP